MKWLITKCRKVSETLKKKSVSNLAKSATFVSEDDSDGSPTDGNFDNHHIKKIFIYKYNP